MIGILGRFDYTPSGKQAYIIYKSIVDIIRNYNVRVIGIIPDKLENVKDVLNMCKGIVLTGGDHDIVDDKDIIKYVYDNNIPCLGICMGMQEMALLFNGELGDIDNHYLTNHKVVINSSGVYQDGIIYVNSRHHEYIKKTDLLVTGKSLDNVIEMVEDKDKLFFVGVQWHPENMDNLDSKLLFDGFIQAIKNV